MPKQRQIHSPEFKVKVAVDAIAERLNQRPRAIHG
jgi:hypothetical protein